MAKSVKINGVTYENVPSVDIPLSAGTGDATFYETSADDGAAADVLSGKTVHSLGGPITGSMANNGAVTAMITTKAQSVAVAAGYHNGSGTVSIDSGEQDKLVTDNIRAGVTVLGVSGKAAVVDTTVSSDPITAASVMSGKKGYANGALITGAASVPTVSQDSTTKVLSIA